MRSAGAVAAVAAGPDGRDQVPGGGGGVRRGLPAGVRRGEPGRPRPGLT
jgi:hypothetical protein